MRCSSNRASARISGRDFAAAVRFRGRALYWIVPDRSHYPTRKTTLDAEGRGAPHDGLSPAERVALVWPLTVQAWQFKETGFRESRLRRDVVRIVRGRR